MLKACNTILLGAVLRALATAEPAWAQTTQPQMPVMGWQMTWPMVVGCAFLIILALLAAAALIKYLFFR